jgi:uncharacterized membrane protein
VLIALKGFADYYKESGIFNNALYAVIAATVGIIVVALVGIFAFAGLFSALGLNIRSLQDWAALQDINWQAVNMDILLRFGAEILIGLVALFAFVLLTAVFLRRSLGLMATKSGIGMFHTTGTLLLVGAILTIILVGIILVWIAMLLLAIAFFSIRIQQSQPPTAAPTQAPTAV